MYEYRMQSFGAFILHLIYLMMMAMLSAVAGDAIDRALGPCRELLAGGVEYGLFDRFLS